MKTCSKCDITKDIGCFAKQAKASDGLFSWCKDCQRTYRKDKYNQDLEMSRYHTNDRRADRIKWCQDLKSNTPCIDCGQIYEPYCMDYDHIPDRGDKIKNVSRMVIDSASKEIILAEIEKCDLVCILCHNKRTLNRFDKELGYDRAYRSHQQRNIVIISEFKNKSCVMCGKQYEPCNMQIDHIDPTTKLYNVCDLKSRKVEILLTELAKCQVLCALCHRRKSIIEQKDNKYSAPRAKPSKRQGLFYDSITNTKECGRCYKIKNGSDFRQNQKTLSGLDTYCKECFNEYRREKRKQTSTFIN